MAACAIVCAADIFPLEKNNEFQVELPQGRDIRRINGPNDLKPNELEAIRPLDDGIRYYFKEFKTVRNAGSVKFNKIDMHFITLIPLDYLSVDRFAVDVLGADSTLKTADGIMRTLPHFIDFLQSISTGKIDRQTKKIGKLEDITLIYIIDDKKIDRKYPNLKKKINTHIKYFSLDLRNAYDDILMSLDYAESRVTVKMLLDPQGYFAPMENVGRAKPDRKKSIGIDDVKNGVRIYLDAGFRSNAMLIEIFKLFTVDVKRFRIQVDMRQITGKFEITWKTVAVDLGEITVAGINPQPIKDNLVHLRNSLYGNIYFMPAKYADGEPCTFMKIFGTGEEMDNWLIRLALLTWENIGGEIFADLSVPLIEALSAVRMDISEHESEK